MLGGPAVGDSGPIPAPDRKPEAQLWHWQDTCNLKNLKKLISNQASHSLTSSRHRHAPFGTGALLAYRMRTPRSRKLRQAFFRPAAESLCTSRVLQVTYCKGAAGTMQRQNSAVPCRPVLAHGSPGTEPLTVSLCHYRGLRPLPAGRCRRAKAGLVEYSVRQERAGWNLGHGDLHWRD
jgi:hypothetical protein